jgi:hypothetical protein
MCPTVDGLSDGLRFGHPVAAAPGGISGLTGPDSSGHRQEDFNVRIESGNACDDGDCRTFAVSPEFLLIR